MTGPAAAAGPQPDSATGSRRRSPHASRRSSSGSIPIRRSCGRPPSSARARRARALAATLSAADGGRRRRGRDAPAPAAGASRARDRRRGARPLPRADRRRRARRASRSSPSSPASSASASPAGSRSSTSARTRARRPARARRRQARRRPRHRRGLRAGAGRQHAVAVRPVPACDADAFTANPLLGRDALAPLIDGARAAGAGVFVLVRTSNPGAADVLDLELADGERAVGAPGAASSTSSGEGEPLADVGAVTGATEPEHLARMRELMPRTPFLLPGVGAQGGDVASARARVRAGPRRRASSPPRARSPTPTSTRGGAPGARPPARRPSACASRLGTGLSAA